MKSFPLLSLALAICLEACTDSPRQSAKVAEGQDSRQAIGGTEAQDVQLFCEYPDRGNNPPDCEKKGGGLAFSTAPPDCSADHEYYDLIKPCYDAVMSGGSLQGTCEKKYQLIPSDPAVISELMYFAEEMMIASCTSPSIRSFAVFGRFLIGQGRIRETGEHACGYNTAVLNDMQGCQDALTNGTEEEHELCKKHGLSVADKHTTETLNRLITIYEKRKTVACGDKQESASQ